MTTVFAISNQKGGVGKTTTAVNLGAYFALAGYKALVIDADPQANATSALGVDKRRSQPSVYEALVGAATLADVRVAVSPPGLTLAPAAITLAGAEIELVGLMAREQRLARVLQPCLGQHDYVLIDTPPSLGLLTVNALTAADAVLIPVQCEYLALEGLGQLTHTIELIRENLNPRLRLFGIVLTMFDARTNLSQQVVDEVRAHFPAVTLDTVIPRNVRLSEAPSYGRPIASYDASSRGAKAYAALADEIVHRLRAGEST